MSDHKPYNRKIFRNPGVSDPLTPYNHPLEVQSNQDDGLNVSQDFENKNCFDTYLKNRYTIYALFEGIDSNVNGDPNLINHPRMDPLTYLGIVSSQCIKRKFRNAVEMYVQELKMNGYKTPPGLEILISSGAVLNSKIDSIFDECFNNKIKPKNNSEIFNKRIQDRYYDVRAFGQVTSTGKNKKFGTPIKGALQTSLAKSFHPIMTDTMSITRICSTKDEVDKANKTMGVKHRVPYGLYHFDINVNPHDAIKNGFTTNDLEFFVEELLFKMFYCDQSSERSGVNLRQVVIFKHSTMRGDAPEFRLKECIKVTLKPGISEPMHFSDYIVDLQFDQSKFPTIECYNIIF